MLRNTDRSWGAPARLLHWLVAALVFAQIGLGWAAVSWRLSPTKLDLFVWHKSIGMLVLALTFARLAWRLANPAPALPPGMSPLERRAARASHLLLYLLMLLLPATGWILTSAANVPFRIFWLVPLPAIAAPDESVADAAAAAHFVLFVALALLTLVHIAAALRHHFVHRDDVLLRMLRGTRGSA
jgi:cytochrome b561